MRLKLSCLILFGFLFSFDVRAQEAAPETEPQAVQEFRFALPDTNDGLAGAGPIRRYDWMRQVWNQRRTTFAGRAEQDEGAIVFLGDSITQGWGDDFGGNFDGLNVNVANRGISGDTTRGMLLRLDEDVLSLDPVGVVMLMGTNDLEEHADAKTIAGNVHLILDRLKAHDPAMPIVMCLVMPSSESKSRLADDIRKINEELSSVARGDSQITVVDTYVLFADKNGDAKAAEFPDLLHPNAAGYAKWKSALMPIFATLGIAETDSPMFETEQGYTDLFNGRDLTGWGFRPTPEAMRAGRAKWVASDRSVVWPLVEEAVSFDGMTSSPDGRYRAIAGRLVVTTPPEGRRIQQLYTTGDIKGDFTLKLEFRAGVNADSGVFLRGHQLQVRDFPLAGPYKDLKDFRSGDWNELVVEVRGDKARCTCNGEVLEAEFEVPAVGPIGLEGDRGQIEYRRIRVQAAP